MASYEVEWKTSAVRELRGIDKQYIPRIIETVESLSNNPFPSQHRNLHGVEASYRIRVGDYRVIYQVAKTLPYAIEDSLEEIRHLFAPYLIQGKPS
jgi:mRNA interferase RelE/StbE